GGSFGKPMVAKVAIDGGEPVPASEIFIGHHPTISPDGKLIAGFYVDEEHPYLAKKIALLSAVGGELKKVIDRPSTNEVPGYIWTTDGRAIMYIDTQKGISNIWALPIDGGPPRKVTDFNSEQIFYFGWSHDGKQLLCARGGETSDAVLIENFH